MTTNRHNRNTPIAYRAKLNGVWYRGDKPFASYSGPDKFRGGVAWHDTAIAAKNRANRTVIGSWKSAIPVYADGR